MTPDMTPKSPKTGRLTPERRAAFARAAADLGDRIQAAASNPRDLPEWRAAQADYLAGEGDPDEAFIRRVRAAWRMRDIERAYGSSGGSGSTT